MRRTLRRSLFAFAPSNRSRTRLLRTVAALASTALLVPLLAIANGAPAAVAEPAALVESAPVSAPAAAVVAETDAPTCGCVGDFVDPASTGAALNDPVEPGADGLSDDGEYRVERDTLAETAVVVRVADERELFEIVVDDFTLGFGFSPDGGRFVVYGAVTRLFDLEEDGREILSMDSHDVTIGFSPDGRFMLARWVEDMTDIRGRLFDARTGDVISLQGAETITALDGVGFGPGSETFWVGTPSTSHVYRTSDWSLAVTRNTGAAAAVYFSPFGEYVQVVVAQGTQIELWIVRLADGAEVYRTLFDAVAPAPGPGGSSDRGAARWGFSPDGRSFAVVSRVAYDAQVTVTDLDTAEQIVRVTGLEWSPESQPGVGFSPCGDAFALTSDHSGAPQTALYSTHDGTILDETLLASVEEGALFDGRTITVRATPDAFEAVDGDIVRQLAPNLICAEFHLSALEELAGGSPATLTVNLDRPAPPGGFPLRVSSDSPLITPPASVTVPAGAMTVDVVAQTAAPEEDTPVTLSLDLDIPHQTSTGPSTITVMITAPRLWYLSIDDWTALQGGTTGHGDVYLHDPAPAGGVEVSLSADDDVLGLPDTVTVAEGQESAAFSFDIGTIPSNRDVTVTAEARGSAVSLVTTVIGRDDSEGVPGAVPNVRLQVDAWGYALRWGTPADGGSPITGYRISVLDYWEEVVEPYLGQEPHRLTEYDIDVPASRHVHTGTHLVEFPRLRGVTHFRVTALNAHGAGPMSPVQEVTWIHSSTNSLPPAPTWPPVQEPVLELVEASDGLPAPKPVVVGNVIGIEAGGFLPRERVVFSLFSDPVHLGDAYADADGVVRRMVTVPADTPLGLHTVVVSGVQSPTVRAASITAGENFTVNGTINGMTFSADSRTPDAGATLTGYDPSICGTDVVIPREVTLAGVEYDVTTIGMDAFNLKGLTSVYIPNSVTVIEEAAFYRNRLVEVRIPDSVITIGDRAFYNNHLLEHVTIGDSVTSIGARAFYSSMLREITIPNSVTEIGPYAFQYNHASSITIGDAVTVVGEYAFQYSGSSLGPTLLELGSSIIEIGDYAFAHAGIDEVTIPDSVRTIGSRAFLHNGLTELTLGSSVETLGSWSFYENNLTEVTIPDSVLVIGQRAFAAATYYTSLRSVRLGSSVTTIEDAAFAGQFYTEVTIPASVTSIGERAFAGGNLDDVYFEGDAPSISPGDSPYPSFGDAMLLSRFKLLHFCTGAEGFTAPVWQGYDTEEHSACDFAARHAPAADRSAERPLSVSADAEAEPSVTSNMRIPLPELRFDSGVPSLRDFVIPVRTHDIQPAAAATCEMPQLFTVTFDSAGGSAVDPVVIAEHDRLLAPADPVRDGYRFSGWHTDAAASQLFDLATPITGDLALYAGWEDRVIDPVKPPEAAIEGPTEVVAGSTSTYRALDRNGLPEVSAAASSDLVYAWDSDGDGEFDDGRAATIDITFADPGLRTIAVRVENTAGAMIATLDITVSPMDEDTDPPPDETVPSPDPSGEEPPPPDESGDERMPTAPEPSAPAVTPEASRPTPGELPATGDTIDGTLTAIVVTLLGLSGLLMLRRRRRTQRGA